jgi:hypothetical protein
LRRAIPASPIRPIPVVMSPRVLGSGVTIVSPCTSPCSSLCAVKAVPSLSEPLIPKADVPDKVKVPEENALWKSVFPRLTTVRLPPEKLRTFGSEVAASVPVARVTVPVAEAN